MPHPTKDTTWLDQSPDVLLEMISHLNPLDSINLTIAHPEVFLGSKLNIFTLDAERLLKWIDPVSDDDTEGEVQIKASRNLTAEEYQENVPLLQVAIENDISIATLREILAAYARVCATSINGLWGKTLSPYDLPLVKATEPARNKEKSVLDIEMKPP
ncbi:hypothetical protein F5Y09DRAFT_308830 [Xylaria sp. FL1042]|nr:hypothetical protein F5Y09DRAFT_308830 [Xylaria sp. FL1042]